MLFREHMKDPNVVRRLGMISLILATLANRFLHGSAHLGENFTDGLKGVLYGLAIGFLLLSVWRRGPRCSA
jgi:hypothetical protein